MIPEITDHHLATVRPLMERWRNTGKIPPVMLLTGPRGISNGVAARLIAQTLNCESSAAAPCNQCPNCVRQAHGNSVDLVEISPEESETGKVGSIKLHQFDEIKASLGRGPHSGAFRVVVIDSAEQMTVQTANSLLKLLEEPPPRWVFILTAADSTLLLPTLVSRCQIIRLRPLPDQIARALVEDEVLEKQKKILAFIQNPGSELNSLVDWAASDPRYFSILLDLLEQYLTSLIRWSCNTDDGTLAFPELSLHAQMLVRQTGSPEAARQKWIELSEKIFKTRTILQAPLNRKLLVQDVLLPWLSLV